MLLFDVAVLVPPVEVDAPPVAVAAPPAAVTITVTLLPGLVARPAATVVSS